MTLQRRTDTGDLLMIGSGPDIGDLMNQCCCDPVPVACPYTGAGGGNPTPTPLQISGYVDTLFSIGGTCTPGTMAGTQWAGNLNRNGNCTWYNPGTFGPQESLNGGLAISIIELAFYSGGGIVWSGGATPFWGIYIQLDGGMTENSQVIWTGVKGSGSTVFGTYNFDPIFGASFLAANPAKSDCLNSSPASIVIV